MNRKMRLGHELVYSEKKHENEFTPPWIKFTLATFEQEISLLRIYPT